MCVVCAALCVCVHQLQKYISPFSLSVCPLITSVAVPPKLFADSQASFYVTVATHSPSAFNHPCISHPCISHSASDTSPPSLLPPRIATHTGFLEVTVAYSITVPSVGSVTLNLDPLTAVHSTCGATVVTNLGYHSSYELDIVEGVFLAERGRDGGKES